MNVADLLRACVMVVFEIVYFAHAFRKSDITCMNLTPPG